MPAPSPRQTRYERPRQLAEALELLADHPFRIMAGGTDVYPALVGKPMPEAILDISAIDGLSGVFRDGKTIRIGATTTWRQICDEALPQAFDGLKHAARQVGAIQVQNRGTIGGNLCNASPAADGIPPLLALDAAVEVTGQSGTRQLALSDFITGYRQTALAPGEMLTAVLVPEPKSGTVSVFSKLGARAYLVISIVMVAVTLSRRDDGALGHVAVSVGSASAKALRLPALEHDLVGLAAGVRPSTRLKPDHLSALQPIDDVRATGAYRLDAALQMVGDALDRAAGFAA